VAFDMNYRQMCTNTKDCKGSSSSVDIMNGEEGDSDSALTEIVRCRVSIGGQCCELCRSINTCSYTYSTLSRASGGTHRSTGKETVLAVDECKTVDNAANGEQISTEGTLLRSGIASEYRTRLSPAYADRRKILIERKQIDNHHVVQFREEFPYECCMFKDMCLLEEEWLKFMRGLNRRCLALNRKVTMERFVGLSCCRCVNTSDDARGQNVVTNYIQQYNKKFFIPHGCLLIDPLETDYAVLELVVLDAHLPRTVLTLPRAGTLPMIPDDSRSRSDFEC
uniref:Uncharacterized protein n=1 Tax=Parascaris univalens TaxID=6257 RepID=A0A915A4Q7_PARUN